MNKLLSTLIAGTIMSVSSTAYAACPDPATGDANITVSERAYDLSADGGKTFAVDIGGSTSWNDCGMNGEGFLPAQASIRLDLRAAEGKQLLIDVTKSCSGTYMFAHAGGFRSIVSGNPAYENVSVVIPRANIGDEQTIMIYLSTSIAGDVCSGEIRFQTARE